MKYFFIAAMTLLADSYSKFKIKELIPVGEKRQTEFSWLYFWHLKNNGAAYNLLSKKSKLIIYGSGASICGIFLALFNLTLKKGKALLKLGLAFILGGALGNFIDRLKNNTVTDFIFIDKKHWPIFNVADVFIVLGLILSFLTNSSKD